MLRLWDSPKIGKLSHYGNSNLGIILSISKYPTILFTMNSGEARLLFAVRVLVIS